MTDIDGVKELVCSWNRAAANVKLTHDSVHIWRICLDEGDPQVGRLHEILSAHEQKKAERFYREEHRRRYTVARGMLRVILGRYLGLRPKELIFTRGLHGKPEVVSVLQGNSVHFNMTHSHELALCVFSKKYPVGIDLEHIRNGIDIEAIASRFFSPREYGVLKSLPGAQRKERFFEMWTIKEAYLKATGEGLGGLKNIEILQGDEDPTAFVSSQETGQPACHEWSAYVIKPAQTYTGCVVVCRPDTVRDSFCCFEANSFVEEQTR